MDLGWGNPKASKWITNVGLVTSDGLHGPNVMAAEWTYYVSYSPGLISVHITGNSKDLSAKATLENIRATKEFGVSIASDDQNVISSIAGGSAGKNVSKVALLKEYGAEFYKAKHIRPLLVKGAATNAECRVKEMLDVGDHVMIIGEVLDIETDLSKSPLAYSGNKYWKLGQHIEKPPQEILDRISALKAKYSKTK